MEERQQSLEIDVNTVDNCGGAPTTDDGDNVERQQSLEIDVNNVDNYGGAPTTDDGDKVENSLLSKPGVEQFIKQCLSRPGCCLRLMNIAFYAIFAIILFRVPVEQNEPRIGIVYQSTEVKDFIPQPDGTTIGTWGKLKRRL